ncbi:GGDEF domain-containing protein [Methylotenera sp. G11]|uniref:GGDEF domain-containing protein n=1 Tax=Methylotenera sp. G11 TaxID=1506585 RepID=UPI000A45AB1A|nr:GGDEF domain-containing protein [Methylotenera sp. G11]
MSGILFVIARNYPKSIHGLSQWYQSSFLLALSLPLFLARGHIPDLLSIVLANLLILLCFMMMNSGTRKFAGAGAYNIKLMLLFVCVYILLFAWFTYIQPNIAIRVVCLSLFTLVVTVDQLVLVLKKLPDTTGRNMLILALAGMIITRIIRVASLALGYDAPASVLDSSISQLIFLATPAVMIPLATISYITLATEKLHQDLEYMSHHDDLTGCLNKKTATRELEKEISRARRYHQTFSIMMIDLDNFKNINDTYGHLEGDKVLVDFAQKAKAAIRETDQISRFGGDEFLIILPNTSIKEALFSSERIHLAASAPNRSGWSASIGIAEWQGHNDSLDALLNRADKSLYLSKKLGKNQTQTDSLPYSGHAL